MNIQLYTPHDNQRLIHQSKAQYRVCVAGRRFGKSALALNEALARAFQLKDQIIWIVLPLFRQAKEVYWIDPDITKYFMPYIQAGLIKQDKNDLSLHVLSTNSWIRLKGSDNYDSLRGSGLDLIIWDEVADTKLDAFEAIAPALADSPRHRVLYIGTPKGLNHFHDFALYGNHSGVIPTFEKPLSTKKDWETWHFSSLDNLSWEEGTYERQQFVAYIANQRAEAEEKGRLAFFNQEYMASFEESAGRFFPKWSYKTHVLDEVFYPDDKYIRIGSFDWGRTAPFAWYAHVIIPTEFENHKFNRVVTFKEVYDTNKSPYEVAQLISGKIDYKTVRTTYIDPSMGRPMEDGSASIVRQLSRSFEEITKSTPLFVPAANKRVARWVIMDNWMRIMPDGLPGWMITKDCVNLIRTLPLMIPDSHNLEDLDSTTEDHACFVAGTMIKTTRGNIDIVDIKEGDMVMTPMGNKKVLASSCTGIYNTYRYTFKEHALICTPDHKIATTQGFLPIHQIMLGLMDEVTLLMVGIGEEEIVERAYIKMFGFFLMEKFQKNIIYITRIIIKGIILLIIWFACLLRITQNTILIKDIRKKSFINTIAYYARRNIYPQVSRQLIALVLADPRPSESQVFIILRKYASSVLVFLKVINITTKNIALIDAKCSNNGLKKVYNLTVENGMYFANDILVSNCDSVSYALQYIAWKDISHKPIKPGATKGKLPSNPYDLRYLSKFRK